MRRVALGCRVLSVVTAPRARRSNWGDQEHIGCTGVQVLDSDFRPHVLKSDSIRCVYPRRSTSTVEACAVLVSGDGNSTDASHMWLLPYELNPFELSSAAAILRIDVGKTAPIGGLKIWNYNATVEDTFKGAYCCCVHTTAALLRRARARYRRRQAVGRFH